MFMNKSTIYTSIFVVVVISLIIAMEAIKPFGGSCTLLHAFSPVFAGISTTYAIFHFYEWAKANYDDNDEESL